MSSTITNDVFVEYSATDHGFFSELVRLSICVSAIGTGFEIQKNGAAKAFTAGDSMAIQGKHEVSGLEIHFFPYSTYERLLSPTNRQPRFLKVLKRPITSSPPNHPIKLTKIQMMMARLIGDAFVSYYERHLASANAKWGKEFKGGWPSIWEFGWAVRNSCAHDGKIYFMSEKHKAVEWMGLKYSYSDNGRPILFDDLTGVELILLMEEMDSALRKPVTSVTAH